jgi:hypothetical protein
LRTVRVSEPQRVAGDHNGGPHAIHIADVAAYSSGCAFARQNLARVVVALMGYDGAPGVVNGYNSSVLYWAKDYIRPLCRHELF